MASRPNRPRGYSLSRRVEDTRGPSRLGGAGRHGGYGRSKSVSNIADAREACADSSSLRELAEFLRTTGPPRSRVGSYEECLKLPGSWSIQSLRKATIKGRNAGPPPDNAVAETTRDGHRYLAIATPMRRDRTCRDTDEASGPWFRSQYPVFVPERTSSAPGVRSRSVKGQLPPEPTSGQCSRQSSGSRMTVPAHKCDPPTGLMPEQRPAWQQVLQVQGGTARSWRDSISTAEPTAASVRDQRPASDLPKAPGPHRHCRKPATIMVRPLLTVPQGALLPDSPGFPNMLAAMTFPSPPKQSTASSSSESVHSLPNRSNPVVGARTSSRRASTSAVTSVTSLDDVMMQRRSSSRSTAATETYRQSAATESSCRRSFRTELTDMSEEAFARPLPSIDRQPKGLGDSEEVASSERSNTPNTTSSLAGPDQEPTPAVVEDRRKARQAKVRQYKQRDVRLSKEFASVPSPTSSRALDSPVLGWSPSRGHRPVSPSSSLRSRNSAECRHAASRGSISLEMDGSSSVSESTTIESTQNERSRSPKATSSAPNPAGRATNVRANAAGLKHETKVPWEFSPVMVTCVEPSPSPAPVLTISPVIIVADVASQPNRTLRPSASSQWTDYGAAPTLPSRSVFRPRSIKVIPQGRSRPVTTMFRNPSTGAVERSPPLDRKLHRHSLINIPTPPMSPDTPLLSKRMSLPLRVAFEPTSRLSPEPTVIERPEPSPTWQGAESTESERRSASIRERIMKQKQEKEREISEIVARTVGLPKTDTQRDHSVQQVDEDRQRSDKIEERLLRLEQNNDAWLKSMKPLLENMAKILKDMREGGTRHPSLRMSDFIVDMEVEASRFSMYSQRPNVGDSMKQAADFPGFDGASEQMGDHAEEEEATDTRAEPAEIRPKPAETRPNLRLEISETPEAREMTGDVHAAEADAAEADAAPRRPSTGTPRTPREHEFEAQASIKRRIQQQEAMMENLLARWGTPTQRSSQLDEISLEDKNRSTPESTRKQNGDSRSVATSKSVENAEDLDPMIGEPRRGPKSEARLVKDVPEDGRLEYKDKRGDNSLNPLRLNPLMREPSSASHLSAEG